jgi:hypothetical protein
VTEQRGSSAIQAVATGTNRGRSSILICPFSMSPKVFQHPSPRHLVPPPTPAPHRRSHENSVPRRGIELNYNELWERRVCDCARPYVETGPGHPWSSLVIVPSPNFLLALFVFFPRRSRKGIIEAEHIASLLYVFISPIVRLYDAARRRNRLDLRSSRPIMANNKNP